MTTKPTYSIENKIEAALTGTKPLGESAAKPTISIVLEGLNEVIAQHIKETVSVSIQSAFSDPIERKAYLNKGEAAAYIGGSRATLEKLIHKGLPIVTIESKVLISKKSIDEFMKSIEQ